MLVISLMSGSVKTGLLIGLYLPWHDPAAPMVEHHDHGSGKIESQPMALSFLWTVMGYKSWHVSITDLKVYLIS